MIACYDLSRCPPTYDVVAFLALAELERVRRGEDHIDLRILPGPACGFRRDSHWPHSVEERMQLRGRVLVPLCRLLPSVRSVELRADRDGEGWGKGEYLISLPAMLRALKQGSRPLRAGGITPLPGKYITFTLREAEHHPLRNSRAHEWRAAAGALRARGYRVIVIPDTWAVERLSGKVVEPDPWRSDDVPEAARDLESRALLYGHSALNVGICNGPMWLSIFMDAPTLMLRPTTNEAGGCYDDLFYARQGLPRGSQLPTSPPHQRLVWEEDYCDNIVRAVEEMLSAPRS